jgi:hypothetical protein
VPKSELQLNYGEPSVLPPFIPAFIAITNNANKPPVNCLYRDGINSIDVVVNGDAATEVRIPGIATGTTYHVTVTCDNGLSLQRDVVF